MKPVELSALAFFPFDCRVVVVSIFETSNPDEAFFRSGTVHITLLSVYCQS